MFILILVVLTFLLLIVAEKGYERTNYYKNLADETQKLKGAEGKVAYVNTGSTFAFYGIDYASCNLKGLNLALKPQPIERDFAMLKHFEPRYERGATVFIAISDLAFAKLRYVEKNVCNKYYRILGRKEIEGYSFVKALQEKYLPVTTNWKNFFRRFRDVRRNNDGQISVNENDREAIEADAYARCKAWEKEFGLADLKDAGQAARFKEAFAQNIRTVSTMIDWCIERGYFPVLVCLPTASEMDAHFSKEFVNSFYYDNIEAANKRGIPFIDLSLNEKLHDDLLYLDSCRLNAAGRRIVTTYLFRELEKVKANG